MDSNAEKFFFFFSADACVYKSCLQCKIDLCKNANLIYTHAVIEGIKEGKNNPDDVQILSTCERTQNNFYFFLWCISAKRVVHQQAITNQVLNYVS